MTKLFYIANIRIPTEKAHGVAIVKSCESFANAGVDTTLVVPRRRTPYEKSVFDTYGVKNIFVIRFLPTIDLINEKAGKFVFLLQTITFQFSVVAFLLFKDRTTIVFTREASMIPLRILGYKLVFECHVIPKDRALFFALARHASRIVVISAALKRAFIEAGFAPDSVLIAPSGVDLSTFDIDTSKEQARKLLDLPQEARIAVYTGNFTTMGEDKGISDILKALPDVPDVLFVAAGGSDRDRGRYVKEASDLGILGRVVLRGSTTQKMLALYQKAADILLMPFPDTPHYRNHMSPVKMFEYMSAKRPVIASSLPTISEVLDDTTAIMVPAGDPVSLARAMKDFIPAHGETIAARAYEKVFSLYTWKKRTERILSFIGQ